MAAATPPAPPDGPAGLRAEALRPEGDRFCRDCGYGIAGGKRPAVCPMCGGRAWRSRRRLA